MPLPAIPELDRLAAIHQDRWVPYSQANHVAQRVYLAYLSAGRIRPRCILVVAPPGSGKSALSEWLLRRLGGDEIGQSSRPVMHVPAPDFADPSSLYEAVLETIGASRPRGPTSRLRTLVHQHLEVLDTRMLLFDEFQQFNIGVGIGQAVCLNALKAFTASRCSLVAFGTTNSMAVINADDQLLNRFQIIRLLPLSRSELEVFALKLTAVMPLKAETLWTARMFDFVGDLSEGYAGRVSALIEEGAVLAIQSGSERITEEILSSRELTDAIEARNEARMLAGRGKGQHR